MRVRSVGMGREGVCMREELHRLGRLSEGFHVRTRTGSGRVSTFFRTNLSKDLFLIGQETTLSDMSILLMGISLIRMFFF